MAYLSERVRDFGSEDKAGTASKKVKWPVRRILIPVIGVGFGLWAMATAANIYSVGASSTSGTAGFARRITAPQSIALVDSMRHVKWVAASLVPSSSKERDRFWLLHDDCGTKCQPPANSKASLASLPQPGIRRVEPRNVGIDRAALDARFSGAVEKARLSREKLLKLFAREDKSGGEAEVEVRVASLDPDLPVAGALELLRRAGTAPAPSSARFERSLGAAAAADEAREPAFERFAPILAERQRSHELALAYIDILPTEPQGSEEVVVASLDDGDGETLALGIPDTAPLPDRRPKWTPPQETRQTASRQGKDDADEKASKEVLAFAKPDNPSGGIGQAFKDLFSAPDKPDNGTAIYDISAATVTLPDGTKLEAHSGLGHMVDDPRYVDKKMRGPTPPNTYKLVMRESRFHGVEAIRMLPVGDKKMYGRDGILAHTYMLRGGLAQSNGCLVFKHYDRFLKAFKKGHITRIVVVPGRSRSRSVQTAKNGSDA